MSVIKAGTTLTTAYTVEADTTGALEFKTGPSATLAMSISSSGVVTFPATTGFDIASANITNLTSSTATISNTLALSGGTANGMLYLNGSSVVTSSSAVVFDGTNMGLGVTPSAWALSGSAALQVKNAGFWGYNNDAYVFANTYVDSGGGTKYIANGFASYYHQTSGQHRWITAASGSADGTVSGTQAMTLNASNNLLLGTTSDPGYGRTTASVYHADGGIVQVAGSATTAALYVFQPDNIAILGTTTNHPLAFNTNSTERARITSGGDLLVGTTSFTNAANKGLAVRFSSATNSGGEGGVEIRNTSSSVNSDPNPPLIIYKGSTTTSSDQRFIQFYANDTGQPMGGIVGNGATNVQFVSLSDVREKKNIKPISGSLEKVTALNPVSFEWIKSGEVVGAGFVAQDVEQVFPEFVVENFSNNDEEPRKGLTGGMTGGIIPHLVKAIQELSAKNDALEARLAALEAK